MLGSITNNQSSVSLTNLRIGTSNSIYKLITQKNYKWSEHLLNNQQYQAYFNRYCIEQKFNVVVLDYGVKFNILNRLMFYGCNITVMPGSTSYKKILQKEPDGILFSNDYNIPIFGICLGHQLLSLAIGVKTHKLKFGHRGLNHPSGSSNITRITSQNHGYVVSIDTIPPKIVDFIDWNLNDQTLSGIVHKSKPYFSVQYHPEASPGPHDSDYLFAHFIKIMSLFK